MVIDGLFGTDRVLSFLGWFLWFYNGNRRHFRFCYSYCHHRISFPSFYFMHIKTFFMARKWNPFSKIDANAALAIIGILMISLLGMNTFYILYSKAAGHDIAGVFPVSNIIAGCFGPLSKSSLHTWHEINWWAHILWIFIFANMLPYSKHFHVFMSVPNVFLSRLEPLGISLQYAWNY